MCTNQAFKCMFSSSNNNNNNNTFGKLNDSMLSTDYYKTMPSLRKVKLNQIKILFDNKYKLLTGIEDQTTFRDLILAVLVSLNEMETDEKKKQSKHSLLNSVDNYVIYELIDDVERPLDSSLTVKHELKRMRENKTSVVVSHVMRLKPTTMPIVTGRSKTKSRSKTPVSVDLAQAVVMPGKSKSNIDRALSKFEQHIEERKAYVKLLEDYLAVLESIESEKEHLLQKLILSSAPPTTTTTPSSVANLSNLIVYDSDSTDDTGFNSVESSGANSCNNSNSNSPTLVTSTTGARKKSSPNKFETYV